MTPSLRKKIVTLVVSQWKVQEALELIDVLLVLMKKFGKQLSQEPIQWFFQTNYPEVYELYRLLGASRCTIKHCLWLQQQLQQWMGDTSLFVDVSNSSITSALNKVADDAVISVWWDVTNPVLSIHSSKKVYRRSLSGDLQKLLF